jgi:hypothetical protein
MARTAISVAKIVGQDAVGLHAENGCLITSGSVAFDQANGHSLTNAYGMFPLDKPLYLIVSNTDTADHVITFAKGASTYAGGLAAGDLTFTVPAGTTRTIGPISLPRHAQDASTTINVDGDSGTAGTITCEVRKA